MDVYYLIVYYTRVSFFFISIEMENFIMAIVVEWIRPGCDARI